MDARGSKPIYPRELEITLDRTSAGECSALLESSVKDACGPVLDSFDLLQRVSDDRELLAELAEIFRADYPRQLQSAHNALERADTAALSAIGHTIKGTLSNLSACRAAALAARLESTAQDGSLAQSRVLLQQLGPALTDVATALAVLTAEASA